jgi:hypothetical protein
MKRTTTTREDEDFVSAMDLKHLLERAAEYIAGNFDPEDIYPEEKLREWALDNGFVKSEE